MLSERERDKEGNGERGKVPSWRETRKGIESQWRHHLGWEGRRKASSRNLNEPEEYSRDGLPHLKKTPLCIPA